MKIIALTFSLIAFCNVSLSQDESSTLQGENLDLYATLELFKESESVEDFENQLNSEKNGINNLDLNNDGFVDYIRVIDYTDNNIHTLTLQVPFEGDEAQDIAVIELDKNGDKTTVQIVGDEDLYGSDFIVEPTSENESTAVNVNNWKPVRHIYSPNYVIWVSPWRYNHHPRLYKPWRPVSVIVYHSHTHRHHVHYRKVNFHRSHRAHSHYKKHRVHTTVHHKHHSPKAKTHHKPRTKTKAKRHHKKHH